MQLTYQDLICVLYKGNQSYFYRERDNKLSKLGGVLSRGVCLQLLQS